MTLRRNYLLFALIALTLALTTCGGSEPASNPDRFEPTWESVSRHQLPKWYDDAKLGIFIHWGLYSVPAYAPTTRKPEISITAIFKMLFKEDAFADNPYAEWYLNSLRIDGSPVQMHHRSKYGEDFDYYDFAKTFNEEVQAWNPGEWADLFREGGARYVVLTTKHHDGFTLWPSGVKHPHLSPDRQAAKRDLVGELTGAVRSRNMRMGLYYSGGLDWGFVNRPIKSLGDLMGTVPPSKEYADFSDAQWRELIERYEPSVLWNDIAYPEHGDVLGIFSEYYNRFPEGVINNRWRTPSQAKKTFFTLGLAGGEYFYDFDTPEYAQKDEITEEKWETCRGMGWSFGYNAAENEEHTLSAEELIESFIDIVSKNGNLLLNVGPMANGTIPEIQVDRLRSLGAWLKVNGEAIFGTRPWERAEGETGDGGRVRFTSKDEVIYAILLDKPKANPVNIESFSVPDGTRIELLGHGEPLEWEQHWRSLDVKLPRGAPDTCAHVLKISTAP